MHIAHTTTASSYRSHVKALASLGVPIMIGQFGIIIQGVLNTVMVGHYTTSALSAAGFVNNVMVLALVFVTGFAFALTPVVGVFHAKGEYDKVGRALKSGLWTNFFLAFPVVGAMLVLYANLSRLGQPEELLPLIRPYFLLLLAGLPFQMLFDGFKQFADGIGDTKVSMWLLLGANVFNVGSNFLLIYGIGPFPEMGLLGAGISTTISRGIILLIFCYLFFGTKRYAAYRKGFRMKTDWKLYLKLNKMGVPISLQLTMETAAFSLTAVMMGWLGADALASHQIMLNVSTIGFQLYYGIGSAVAIRIAHFHGQGDQVNIKRAAFAGIGMVWTIGVIISIAMYTCRYAFPTLFTDDTVVAEMVVALVIPFMLYQYGDGAQIILSNALRGLEDVRPLTWIAFLSYFVISLPVGYLFAFVWKMGSPGLWFAFPVGLYVAALLYYLRFRRDMKA